MGLKGKEKMKLKYKQEIRFRWEGKKARNFMMENADARTRDLCPAAAAVCVRTRAGVFVQAPPF